MIPSNKVSSFLVFAILLFGMIGTPVLAQNNEGDLEDIEVVIRKDKDIILPRANRNYGKVKETPQFEVKPSKSLDFGSYTIALSPLDPSIRINKLKPEAISKYYGNYVKAGLGNYLNTYLEAFAGNKREDKGYYNIMIAHNAFANGPVENSGNNRNAIGLNAGAFYEDMTLSSNLNFDRTAFNFYGFEEDSVRKSTEANPKHFSDQVFNRLNLGLNLDKHNPSDYFNFNFGLDYNFFNDQMKQTEHWFGLKMKGDYELNFGKSIEFESRYLLANYGLDSISDTRHLFEIAPQFAIPINNLVLKGGFKVSYEGDTALEGDVHVYPMANVEYSLMEDKLVPYAGLEGGIIANGLNTFTLTNPYLDQGNLLSHSNQSLNIYAGLKSSIIKNSWLDARIGFSNIDNLPLFINNPFDQSKFLILYAENASVLNAHLGFNSRVSNNFELGLKIDYFEYGMSDTLEAWHLPSFQSQLNSRYSIRDKIFINVDIFFINGIFAYTSNETKMLLDPIIDLNLKFEYLFSDRFSSFVEVKNILSNNYQRFLYYDSRGIQARAGLTYSF